MLEKNLNQINQAIHLAQKRMMRKRENKRVLSNPSARTVKQEMKRISVFLKRLWPVVSIWKQ